MKLFEDLLDNIYFILKTDHVNLTYINVTCTGKVLRWEMYLQDKDFDLFHVAGKEEQFVPDDLSRLCANHIPPPPTLADKSIIALRPVMDLPQDVYYRIADIHNSLSERPDDEDNLSEESDARRMTKKSTMEVNGHTFEIYGKTAIRENLIKSTGIRRLMQNGHMVTLLKTSGHGSYGNTITAANIIDGVIKLADDNSASSIFSKLNTAVNHNKLQVALQAWWQHTNLHEKIAYGVFEFGHNLTKHSVRCEHFLPLAVATEINYNITTYSHFVEHFKGWRILLHKLLGPRFGKLLQQFLTEMYDEHIGESSYSTRTVSQ